MQIEGEFNVTAPQALVWENIRDPEIMAGCIPGCESIEQIDATSFRSVVAIKVGPISARFNLVVEITEEIAPETIRSRTKGEEGTRASILTSQNVLRLADDGSGGTDVAYAVDVTMTGRLGKYGLGIIRKKADQLAGVFVENFRKRVVP